VTQSFTKLAILVRRLDRAAVPLGGGVAARAIWGWWRWPQGRIWMNWSGRLNGTGRR